MPVDFEHAEQTALPHADTFRRSLELEVLCMERINPRCAGLDVHKDSVFAAARVDGKVCIEKFGTTSRRDCFAWATGWRARA